MPDRTMRRWIAAGGVAAALALGSCGSSSQSTTSSSSSSPSGASAQAWVSTVCGSLQTWGGVVGNAPSALTSPGASADLASVKQAMSAYLGDVVRAGDTAIGAIRSAGNPPVSNGQTTESTFVSNLRSLTDAFNDARQKADALPVNDPAAFASQAEQIANQLKEAGDRTGKAFDSIKADPELDRAARDEPACRALQSSASPSP